MVKGFFVSCMINNSINNSILPNQVCENDHFLVFRTFLQHPRNYLIIKNSFVILGVAKKNIMFVREVKNRSGSISIQIISKARGRYRVVKTAGCATQCPEIARLKITARQEIERLQAQPKLQVRE